MSTKTTNLTNDDRLALRPGEAARMLGVSPRWLWAQTNAGAIPHAKVGRAVLYPVAALRAWLADRSRGGKA